MVTWFPTFLFKKAFPRKNAWYIIMYNLIIHYMYCICIIYSHDGHLFFCWTSLKIPATWDGCQELSHQKPVDGGNRRIFGLLKRKFRIKKRPGCWVVEGHTCSGNIMQMVWLHLLIRNFWFLMYSLNMFEHIVHGVGERKRECTFCTPYQYAPWQLPLSYVHMFIIHLICNATWSGFQSS